MRLLEWSSAPESHHPKFRHPPSGGLHVNCVSSWSLDTSRQSQSNSIHLKLNTQGVTILINSAVPGLSSQLDI